MFGDKAKLNPIVNSYNNVSRHSQHTGVCRQSRLSSATTAQSSQQGAVARGAARGALFGTVGGAIGGNAGQGAAIGAGVGALGGLFVRRDAEVAAAQTQARVNAAEQQQLQTYFRAWTACMEGRGYTVN